MRVCLCLFLFLISSSVSAQATLPNGCEALAVQGETVAVATKKTSLFFVHNLSDMDLWVTHPVENTSASSDWSSRIQSQHWSALVVGKGPFALTCIESRPGHEQEIPCEGAIALCQWKGAKIPVGTQNTYWAGEDLTLAELKAALGGRGFIVSKAK
jgi:hypothetical protein